MSDSVVVQLGKKLRLEDVMAVGFGAEVQLAPEAEAGIQAANALVRERIERTGEPPVYGVNTGFGALAGISIDREKLKELQINLIRSHACGVLEPLSEEVSRMLVLLRAQVLALGHSGARLELVLALVDLLNHGVHPVIPSRGSVGASGDLAPLAHLALVLVGEGEAIFKGERMSGAEALSRAKLKPVELEPKEGLSLINGTQAMTALGTFAYFRARNALESANIVGAMSLEALQGTSKAFDPRIHALRPHPGQIWCAEQIARLLEGSEIAVSHENCDKVQDPYSLRCMPQVHGAVLDGLSYVERVLTIEINSVTDNPLVFAEDDAFISGGNFHGAPVAFALDHLALLLTSLMAISERRIEQLVNPALSSGLPPFLAEDTGLNSGFMIAQVTAASLLTEAKVLAHPASADTIPSSANREDHVSMGMTAALKAFRVVSFAEIVLGIECLCAAQGIDLRAPNRPGKALISVHSAFRERISYVAEDTILQPLIQEAAAWISEGACRDFAGC